MLNKRWIIVLMFLLLFIIGFLPTKNIVKWFFGPEKEDAGVVESTDITQKEKAALPWRKPAEKRDAKTQPDEPGIEREGKIQEAPGIEVASIPREDQFPKYDVVLFDAMENKDFWQNKSDNSTTSSIGLFRGIDGKAVALFYNAGKNGWALIQKTGEWDFTGYKGLRFACRVDGTAGRLTIGIGDHNDLFIEKSWDKSKLAGSAWKIYSVFFENDPEASGRPIGGKVNKVQFRMASDDSEIKGRLIIDNLELLK